MGLIKRFTAFFLPNNQKMHTLSTATDPIEAIESSKESIRPIWPENNADLYSQLEDKYYQYFIGVNSLLDLSLNSFEVKVIESLEKTIKQDHSLAEEIHRLPAIVPKLIHLLKNDDFVWKDVANLIASDPVILVGIIKVAKSPLYNLQVKDEQLENILTQLGLSEVREVTMKVALKPIMSFEGGYFLKHSGTKIWDHAAKTAEASRILAEIYQQDPFDAYLAGLLSNLGMAIVVKKMNKIKEFTSAPISLQFKNKLLALSKQLSVKIADNWNICPSVILALTEQMHLEGNGETKKIASPLGAILYEAAAVSMKHTLVSENCWIKEEQTDNETDDASFDIAYKLLEESIAS